MLLDAENRNQFHYFFTFHYIYVRIPQIQRINNKFSDIISFISYIYIVYYIYHILLYYIIFYINN